MKILFQVMPALVNIITGLFFFISAKRMAESNASPLMVGATMTVWAACYGITAFVLGRILKKRNASALLLAGQIIMLIGLCGLLLMPDVRAQYFWLPATGIGGAMFFTPFQMIVKLFGKAEYGLVSVVRNTAVYTFSWSFGLASGPLIAAFVWGKFSLESGWKYCYMITIAMVLFLIVCILFLRKYVNRRLVELGEYGEIESKPDLPEEQLKLPDLMSTVWVVQFIGYIILAMMRTYIPDHATRSLHLSTYQQGCVMALISYTQAFTGFAFICVRRQQYKPWPVAWAAAGAAAALLIMAYSANWYLYLLAALLLGIYSGTFSFLATYHALINPYKTARYVGGVETIVGVVSTFSPLLGGVLAMQFNVLFPFLFCSVLCLFTIIFYSIRTWKYRSVTCQAKCTFVRLNVH